MAHDVFISHSSVNKKAADAICHALEQNGVKCWIAPRDIPPGANYGSAIIKGIKNCKVFLLVFSKEANMSTAVAKEVERAALGYKKTIIPFRIEDVAMNENLEFFLTDVHWLDAYPNDTVFDNLVNAVKNILAIPDSNIVTPSLPLPAAPPEMEANSPQLGNTPLAQSASQPQATAAIPYIASVQSEVAIYNATNGGMMAQDGNTVYYTKPSVNGKKPIIYKWELGREDTERQELYHSDGYSIAHITIGNNTIYFYESGKGISAMNTDGTNVRLLEGFNEMSELMDKWNPEFMPSHMLLVGNVIYIIFYLFAAEVQINAFYRIDTITGEKRKINTEDEIIHGISAFNGDLYYSLSDEFNTSSVMRIAPGSLSGETVAEDLRATDFLIDKNHIYFFSTYDAYIHRMDLASSSVEQISIKNSDSCFTMDSEYVYYKLGWANVSDNTIICRYNKESLAIDETALSNIENRHGFYMIGGRLHVFARGMLYRVKDDGISFEKTKL